MASAVASCSSSSSSSSCAYATRRLLKAATAGTRSFPSSSVLASPHPRDREGSVQRSYGTSAVVHSSARSSRLVVQRLAPRSQALAFSTSASASTTPTAAAAAAAGKGNGRALLSLSGRDTYKLLQGLMTNDIKLLESQAHLLSSGQSSADPTPNAFYCAFLNPQGRLISTAFLYPHPDTTLEVPHVIVDCHEGNKEALLGFIKRFKLRSKVKIVEMGTGEAAQGTGQGEAAGTNSAEGESSWMIHNVWGPEAAVPPSDASTQVYRDARTPSMGYRVLSSTAARPADPPPSMSYEHLRLTQGVPDGPQELAENQSLPLEANLDLMGGVDFRKGCYVGQELTARTHHTGVVRKRIMPVRIFTPEGAGAGPGLEGGEAPEVGGDLRAPPAASGAAAAGAEGRRRRSKSAGKLLSILPIESGSGDGSGPSHIGLASLRLGLLPKQPFAQGGWLTLQGPAVAEGADGSASAKEWRVEPVWPEWWPESLKAEYQGGEGGGAE